MNHSIPLLSLVALGLLLASRADAALYSADFSTAGTGFTHTTLNPPATSGFANGPNWTVSYTTTPATDSSANSFITAGGALTASDWGGGGSFVTTSIDVSGESFIDILTSGSGTFNSPPTEFFSWHYSLDGGTPVVVSKATGSFNQSWLSVDVSGASSLLVGFDFNHNGAGDGFSIASVEVTAVPEPAAAVLGAFGWLGLLRRRRSA